MQVRNLLATTAATAVVGLLPISVQAATLFGTTGIEVDTPTIVRFTFSGSSNFYNSNASVYLINPASGFVDTVSRVPLFGESTPGAFQDVTFLPGFRYTLGLSNINPSDGTAGLSPIVFSATQSNSTTNLGSGNPNIGLQRVIFGSAGSGTEGVAFPNPDSFTSGNLSAGPVLISFEDGGFDFATNGSLIGPDNDFNDFRFTAQVIPAPILLPGLLAIGARVISRRRKSAEA